jgi:hypothetical protein
MKTVEIEFIMADYYNYRTNYIVPNISWGLNVHECDLLIVRPKTGFAIEVEIKISKSDLIADLKKKHNHKSNKIKELWYAVPEELVEKALEILPEYTGIYAILKTEFLDKRAVKVIRKAKSNNKSRCFTEMEIMKLLRLGNMRIWNLKKKELK